MVAVDGLPPGSRRSRISPEKAGLPSEFQGMRVIVEDLGRAELFSEKEATMNGNGDLNPEEAREVLRLVSTAWLNAKGADAFRVIQGATSNAALGQMPDVPDVLAGLAVKMLLESRDEEVRGWTGKAVRRIKEARGFARAQALDPVTAAIIGGAVIGAILAARVRTVGAATFYEGVPEALADVLKAGEAILSRAAELLPGAGGV